ncbi:MAG TPA: ankyrin repeat domain-containing protein [Terriglobia bacterium]|nr:ankyrin repeat domain-containing protein [Terriglobia bacterium]
MKTRGIWFVAALSCVLTAAASENSASLIDAVKAGNAQAVRNLLKQRPNVNDQEADGMTALHWAARSDDVRTAQLLIRAGANVKAANRYGVTPISLAATNGNATLVEALLKAGADPNTALPESETVLMTAARAGSADAVKALIAHGANVNAREKWQDQTALMWAAGENHADAVKALAAAGADLNAHSRVLNFPEYKYETNGMAVFLLPHGGWTALMYAARENAIDAAAMLADSKADLNAVDADGTTALELAIINLHYDLATLLLNKGADPNVADSTGMTALYAAVDMRAPANMMTRPEPKLRDEIDAAGMVKVLLGHGANPNLKLKKPIIGRHNNLVGDTSLGEGATPLMRAAKANDVAVMRLLVDGGADPTLTLKDRTTTAMAASSLEAIKLLVEHGVDVNAFNTNGQTILHNAAARGNAAIIKYAAEQGARLDRKDKQGRTPLDIAQNGGGGRGGRPNPEAAALLRDLMAKNAR